MKRSLTISLFRMFAFCVVLRSTAATSEPPAASSTPAASPPPGASTTATTGTNHHRVIDADNAYKNNCMRCHTALPQYSPRMNKTVLMHMRVDGNIPGDEAAAILDYLNDASEPAAKVTKR